MERETPEAMLEPDELAQIAAGAAEIRCDVCAAAAKVAVSRAKKVVGATRDEEKLSNIVAGLCYGTHPVRRRRAVTASERGRAHAHPSRPHERSRAPRDRRVVAA